jgi:hypothetical protein
VTVFADVVREMVGAAAVTGTACAGRGVLGALGRTDIDEGARETNDTLAIRPPEKEKGGSAPGFLPAVGVPTTGLFPPAAALEARMRVICALTRLKCRSYSHAACRSRNAVSTPNSAARAGQSISAAPTRPSPSASPPWPSPPVVVLPSVDDAEGGAALAADEGFGFGRAMSFHRRLSLAGVQSTWGGSAKEPRGKGRRTMTVYCGVGCLRGSLDGAMVGLFYRLVDEIYFLGG